MTRLKTFSTSPISYEYYVLNGNMIYKLQYESKHELYTGGISLLNISRFSGCPHVYGKYYAKDGNAYSILHLITKEFLEEGKKSGGDWTGFNEGEYTTRFLREEELNEVKDMFDKIFNTIKE